MQPLAEWDVPWIVRRLPKPVRELLSSRKDVFVAGGFIRSVIANEPVNDIDLFAPSADAAAAVSVALADGDPVHKTENAYSVKVGGVMVQIIHRWTFQTPEECVASFDFTVAKAAVWNDGGWKSTADERFYSDLAAKRLVYTSPVRNEDAGGSMLRLLKFYQRGYRAPLSTVGAVMARMVKSVDFGRVPPQDNPQYEEVLGKVLAGILREVDPNSIEIQSFFD